MDIEKQNKFLMDITNKKIAVWVLTDNGLALARTIAAKSACSVIFASENICANKCRVHVNEIFFKKFSVSVAKEFKNYHAHIFIMSAGIVVRVIAPIIKHKTVDPAVLTIDDAGRYVISLLSGHIGGGNALTEYIGKITGAVPVITTATDVNNVLAVDMLAVEKGLCIENSNAIKYVNMAFLKNKSVLLHDPYGVFDKFHTKGSSPFKKLDVKDLYGVQDKLNNCLCGVYIDHFKIDLPENILVLRPKSLAIGMGCNRGTDKNEILQLIETVFKNYNLSLSAISFMGSIDLKKDESGFLVLSKELDIPFVVFNKKELSMVKGIENPSEMVKKHVGVQSVCEAAAILAAGNGRLIVCKQKTKNVTLAVAERLFI